MGTSIENAQNEYSQVSAMPLIPLRGVLVFPHVVVHLDVGRERSIKALDEAMLNNREIFLAMQKEAQLDDPELDDIYQVGTIAEIKQILKLPGGTIRLVAEGLYRGEIKELVRTEPYLVAEVETRPETVNVSELELEALIRHLRDLFEQYINLNKKIPAEILLTVNSIEDGGRLADVIANNLNLQLPERQEILEAVDVAERIELLLAIITKEMDLLEIERKISGRVRRQVEKNQKEYYLREQIRAIQKELGENEDRASEIEEIKERMEKRDLPDNVREKIEKELSRLRSMPPMVGEASVVHTYIDWLLDLPWTEETEDANDLLKAEEILNEDHYGIFKVKERILEYLAVRQMTNSLKGPILCFVGPPGVGKTSLAKSIAAALNRKYIRISLGGVRDEAEIRGHRRTYIGAMPGRIIQSMKTGGTVNPLFLLDEIDKLANDFRGDPASALLEVLDPEQNNTFADHYVELPYDLSKVMFITTVNVEYDIPRPLLDRMEIIRLSGYTEEEKVQIALKHLIPKQYKEHGLEGKQIFISENAVRIIIREYTREAGVRSLERHIAKVCRRVVRDIVAGKETSGKITAQNVKEYLGVARFRYDTVDKDPQIGVVTGLAWTEVGGEVLTIEAQTMEGKGKLILTGQLGDVMKESAQTGWTYLRSIGKDIGIPANVEENTDIHIHVPEGAIPKDGPSAGIAMATALASIFSKRKVRQDVAMTGEITLRGRVLPIGGVKEKVLAAHRGGAKVIILPAENKKDLEDLPANVKRKLEFHLVEDTREVLEIALLPVAGKKKVAASKPAKED